MSDIRSVEKDLEWGIKQEQIVKPRIEEWIEHNLDKTPDYFNIFDFINDDLYVEFDNTLYKDLKYINIREIFEERFYNEFQYYGYELT